MEMGALFNNRNLRLRWDPRFNIKIKVILQELFVDLNKNVTLWERFEIYQTMFGEC